MWKAIRYIHLNPVRRTLVERAADWKWSSAKWFARDPEARPIIDMPQQGTNWKVPEHWREAAVEADDHS